MIFKQAFRVAFIALIWKQYKASIVSTLLLIAFLFVVSNIHADYLAAVGAENADRLSFVYKWLAYSFAILIYIAFHLVRGRIKPTDVSDREKIQQSKELENTGDDPFAAIRERQTLRSRADFLMDKDDKEN